MTDPKLNIVGVFKDGGSIVLVDAERKQYECSTPQELWSDPMTILGDKALPTATITEEQVSGDDDILRDACDQVADVIGDNYGPFWSRIAGETTRRVGPFAVKTLRNISKRDRFGLRKRYKGGS